MRRVGPQNGVAIVIMAILVGLGVGNGRAVARTVYVSSSQGDDGNDGLSADTNGQSGPFRSIERLTGIQIGEGDQLLFRCGDRFYGQVDINVASGGPAPLRIASYGECGATNVAILDGSRVLGDVLSGGATDGLVTVPSRRNVTQVFADGSAVPQARFPRTGYLVVPAGTPATKEAVAPSMVAGKDVLGAEAWVRTQSWFIENRLVAKMDGGTARFDKPLEWPLDGGSGFYLTGKAWMIGNDPGWARDAANEQLSIRINGTAKELRVSYPEPLVRLTGPGSVVFEDIALERAGEDALAIAVRGDVVVSGVAVRDASRNGIAVSSGRSVTISRSTIERVGQDGILVARLPNVVVRGNVLRDISTAGWPRPALAAINATGSSGATIQGNTIAGAGYIGIRFYDGSTVRENVIEHVCLTMGDCGAIYTWRGNAASDKAAPSIVAGNAIADVPGEASVKPGWRMYAAGIYLDDFTSNVSISGNMIVGARHGIYLHNAYQNTIRGNAIVGSGDANLVLAMDSEKIAATRRLDNVVEDNALYAPEGESSVLIVRRTLNEPLGRFARNTIVGKDGKQQRTAVYRNQGTFAVPSYARADLAAKALTGDDNEEVTEKPRSKGIGPSKWRIESSGGTRRASNGVWVVSQGRGGVPTERGGQWTDCRQVRGGAGKGDSSGSEDIGSNIEICGSVQN